MKKRIIIGVMAIVVVMVLAGTIIPIAKDMTPKENPQYVPKTVVLDDPFANKVSMILDNVSGEYSYDTRGNLTYSVSTEIGNILPDSPEYLKNEKIDILAIFDSPDNPTITYKLHSDSSEATILDYSVVYDESGAFEDIVFTCEGTNMSLRGLYGSYEDCVVFLAIVPFLPEIFAAAAVAGAIVVDALTNNNTPTPNNAPAPEVILTIGCKNIGAVNISFNQKTKEIFYVNILGVKYNLASLITDPKNLDKNSFYCAILWENKVYIVPKAISKTIAQNIMKEPINPGGTISVWTYYGSNALDIASVLGAPLIENPNIHGNGAKGYYHHYHTNAHKTDAHAFYGPPS